MKPGITSVRAVPCELLPSPASSSVSSSRSIYPSINFSFFHRANRSRIAADSGGNPRMAETSLICTNCSWSISEGVKTLNLTSYGLRFCVRRSLSSEKPVSKSLKSKLVTREGESGQQILGHPSSFSSDPRDHVDHARNPSSSSLYQRTFTQTLIITTLCIEKIIRTRHITHKIIIRVHAARGRRRRRDTTLLQIQAGVTSRATPLGILGGDRHGRSLLGA